jgi:hypothetical protein
MIQTINMNQIEDQVLTPRFLRIHKARIGKSWIWSEHTNQEMELVLVKKGKIRCSINKKEFVVNSGCIYFVQPGQLHHEEIISEHLDIFTLRFDLRDVEGNSCGFIHQDNIKTQCLKDLKKQLGKILEQILKLVWEDKPGVEQKIESLILQSLAILRQRLKGTDSQSENKRISPHHRNLVKKAEAFIRQNTHHTMTLNELARHCCVSPNHLVHVFKNVMGVPPKKYAQRLRMDHAKRLLSDSSICI